MAYQFKVGDRVRRMLPCGNPNEWGVVGQEYTVLELSPSGTDIVIVAGATGAAMNAFQLVSSAPPQAVRDATWQGGWKKGDKVRYIDTPQDAFITGHVYEVIEEEEETRLNYPSTHFMTHVKEPKRSTGIGVAFSFRFERADALAETVGQILYAPPKVEIPAHRCEDNRKTYDSGWSRYDYCALCDLKIKETA